MNQHEWLPIGPDNNLWMLRYSFGPGPANTLATRLGDGSLLVVSPAAGLPAEKLDELDQHGPVRALLAPNGFHHLGQPLWRKHFPQAVSYAAPGSLARLHKKTGIAFQPLDELTPLLGPNVEIVQPAGQKVPDLLVRTGTSAGDVWFTGDLISNNQPGDLGGIPKLLFKLLGAKDGYVFNPVPAMVYLKDKAAWKADVRGRMQGPLVAVVPGHGALVTGEDLGRTQAILA